MVVILTPKEWQDILKELHTLYPPSAFMLRNKMRNVLGFTIREHNEYIKVDDPVKEPWGYTGSQFSREHTHIHSIRLDFYNERKYTMFLLKFSDKIGKQ